MGFSHDERAGLRAPAKLSGGALVYETRADWETGPSSPLGLLIKPVRVSEGDLNLCYVYWNGTFPYHSRNFSKGTAFLAALGAAVSFLLARRLASPLERLKKEVTAIDAEHLERRVTSEGLPPEVADVATSVNFLAESLERHVKNVKVLSASVSHELRSPLSRLEFALTFMGRGLFWADYELKAARARGFELVGVPEEYLLRMESLSERGDLGRENLGRENIGEENLGEENIGEENIGEENLGEENFSKENFTKTERESEEGDGGNGPLRLALKYLSSYRGEIRNMDRLISENLLESKIDLLGKKLVNPKPVDFSELCRGAAEKYSPILEEKGRVFSFDLSRNLSLLGDRFLLESLLSNILENAAKYALPGGRIRMGLVGKGNGIFLYLENSAELGDLEREGLEIEDLEREDLEREEERKVISLFEPFRRGSGEGKGVGLGLSLAKKISVIHGGTAEGFLSKRGFRLEVFFP
jgi:signal transduction histidine kinase